MDIYSVLEKYAELKGKQDGKKYDYSRARLKANYDQYVNLWKAYYRGDVDGINKDTAFNGLESYPIQRRSMRVAKLLATKWATGLFSEAFRVTLKNDTETDKFRILEKSIDFRSKVNQAAISGYSLGTSALLAYADIETNTETEIITGGKVKLDLIKYDSIFPIVFNSNDIQTIAFVSETQLKDKTLYTIGIHSFQNGKATVENIQATVKGGNVDFSAPETVKQNQSFNNRQYCIIKPNTLNDYSDVLPFGQSIFADSLAACVDVDLAADGLRRDVEESPQMTFVGKDLILDAIGKNGNKKKLFENTRGKFFVIPQKLAEGGGDIKQLFEKSIPEIRADQFWKVIKDSLNWACMTSGLGKGSLDIIPMATATQVIHTESEKMENKSLHEQYLEGQIIQLVRALCELSTLTGNPIDASEVTITFEDSVIEDTTEQKNMSMREIDIGIISPVEYRVKYYGESVEEATAKIAALKNEDNPFDLRGVINED